jgi:8-oxo-dGTP pyrophosphatase MutT (NUDIX family)
VIRVDNPAAGTVVFDPDRGVLLLWRHRFITDTWGWEVPAGRIDPGETAAAAAAREVLEETGWRVDDVRLMCTTQPTNGLSDHEFVLFEATGATYVGDPVDAFEAERVEWVPVEDVRGLVRDGEVRDGLSLTALLWTFAFGPFAARP